MFAVAIGQVVCGIGLVVFALWRQPRRRVTLELVGAALVFTAIFPLIWAITYVMG